MGQIKKVNNGFVVYYLRLSDLRYLDSLCSCKSEPSTANKTRHSTRMNTAERDLQRLHQAAVQSFNQPAANNSSESHFA